LRIAYVQLLLGNELSGVAHAIAGQAKASRDAGLPIDFWIVNPVREGIENGINYTRFEASRLGTRATRLFKSRLLARVRQFDNYDVAFVRYPLAVDLDPLAFRRSRRGRIVTVHHTKEVDEILSGGWTAGTMSRAALESINGRRILSQVDGVIGVTEEIRRYEIKRARRRLPSRMVSNGIDVRNVPHTGFRPFDGRELTLIFIASSHAPWHGTDRLLESLRSYKGNVRITLHMVGQSTSAKPGTRVTDGAVTVVFHGTLRGDQLETLFRGASLAISSLAMHRTGLSQGAVLKTREYVARGLPFVYAYDDVDLGGELPFCMKLPNSDNRFAVEELIQFAATLDDRRDAVTEMRAWATAHVDWKVKMGEYYQFATTLV
jgi:hypothetical protein